MLVGKRTEVRVPPTCSKDKVQTEQGNVQNQNSKSRSNRSDTEPF